MKNAEYVPLAKRSKKEQRRHNATRRSDWNGVVPVTRVIPDKKRKKQSDPRELRRLELL